MIEFLFVFWCAIYLLLGVTVEKVGTKAFHDSAENQSALKNITKEPIFELRKRLSETYVCGVMLCANCSKEKQTLYYKRHNMCNKCGDRLERKDGFKKSR